MAKILIVDDDPKMVMGLRDNLRFDGHTVETAADGKAALRQLLENSYDLVLLDVMLPIMSGFDVLKAMRAKSVATPAIMLTAKGEEIDKVLGLELGADDYVTKPFGLRELMARVNVVLRRKDAPPQAGTHTICLGQFEADCVKYTARRHGRDVAMTAKEYEVLKFLWEHRNHTVSRDQLLTNVWGYDDQMSTRTVDNFILRLRQKIEEDPSQPRFILTVHGLGYKLIQ